MLRNDLAPDMVSRGAIDGPRVARLWRTESRGIIDGARDERSG